MCGFLVSTAHLGKGSIASPINPSRPHLHTNDPQVHDWTHSLIGQTTSCLRKGHKDSTRSRFSQHMSRLRDFDNGEGAREYVQWKQQFSFERRLAQRIDAGNSCQSHLKRSCCQNATSRAYQRTTSIHLDGLFDGPPSIGAHLRRELCSACISRSLGELTPVGPVRFEYIVNEDGVLGWRPVVALLDFLAFGPLGARWRRWRGLVIPGIGRRALAWDHMRTHAATGNRLI